MAYPDRWAKIRKGDRASTAFPNGDPRRCFSRLVPTNSYWAPNCEGETVEGSVMSLSNGALRICFWGADDTGLELDLPYSDEAFDRWAQWLAGLAYIDQADLTARGFGRA